MKTSVVIPNWQGKDLLEKNLPSVMSIQASEVIVVDDGSTDDSVTFLKENYPKVKLVIHKKNRGFVDSVNDGFQKASGDLVILLNTDVVPSSNLLKSTTSLFEDKGVFAITFNEGNWGPAKAILNNGLIEHRPSKVTSKVEKSFWASGGSAVFKKNIWDELGGLDSIYKPFYWEDVDLSYRAQASGYKILWHPDAKVKHEHEATIGKYFKTKKKQWIVERNQIIFFWLNVTSISFWLHHLINMPKRLTKIGYWIPFLWALSYIPDIIERRKKMKNRLVSDQEILEANKP